MDEEKILDTTVTETETAPTEPIAEPAESDLRIGENGELEIPESFWDDEPEPEPIESAPSEPEKPAQYTAEEVAEAFMSGNVDPNRIPPEVTQYYQAIAERQRQVAEYQQQQEYIRQQYQAQYQQQQQAQPQQIDWETLSDASRQLAAQRLGIDPADFDEFNSKHAVAMSVAANDLVNQASMLHQQRQAQEQEQYAAVVRQREFSARLDGLIQERSKTSGIPIAELMRYSGEWIDEIPNKKAQAINEVFNSGNIVKAGAVLDEMVRDYKVRQSGGRARETPPQVMSAVSSAEPSRVVTDVSKLGEMSSEELAAWLINNKYVA